jgi:mannose-6-phosphate isomerase-like protein (cupin superfamily)
MIASQKIKAEKAVDPGRITAHPVHTAAKKRAPVKKNEAKVQTPARHLPSARETPDIPENEPVKARSVHPEEKKIGPVTNNETRIAHPARSHPAHKETPDITTGEQHPAHSLHTAAIMDAQVMKNEAKAAKQIHHPPAGQESHPVSEEAQARAHSQHTAAIMDAQVTKNDAKVVSHNLHNHAGMPAHTVSDEDIAAAIKTHSPEAKNAARNPHFHTGISVQNSSSPEKSGLHKTGKNGFAANLEEETRKNTDFRRVLYTGKHSQLVLMSLKPGEDIGLETHGDVDQFFRFEEGEGIVTIDGTDHMVKNGSGVIVPCGAMHNVTNTSETGFLKLYTIYSPPEHQDKIIRKTKREALSSEEHFDGKTTDKYH